MVSLYFSLFLPGPRLPSDLLAVFEFIVRCLSSPHLLLKSTDVNFFSICQDIYHLFNTQFLAPCFILYFYPSQFKRKILLVLLVLHSGSNSTSAIYLSKYFEGYRVNYVARSSQSQQRSLWSLWVNTFNSSVFPALLLLLHHPPLSPTLLNWRRRHSGRHSPTAAVLLHATDFSWHRMPVMKLGDKLMCHTAIDFSFASGCPQLHGQPAPFLCALCSRAGWQKKPTRVFMKGVTPDYRWHHPSVIHCDTEAKILTSTPAELCKRNLDMVLNTAVFTFVFVVTRILSSQTI